MWRRPNHRIGSKHRVRSASKVGALAPVDSHFNNGRYVGNPDALSDSSTAIETPLGKAQSLSIY
jgi:hypothetical protein